MYPAPLASHVQHRASALIRGRIAEAGGKPWTLVVNGNPVRLATDPGGAFARPWAFGPGSNGVEIRGEGGRVARRVQFSDVDLHVVTPDGQHAFYGNPVLAQKVVEELHVSRQMVERELAMRGPHFTLEQLIAQEELFQRGVPRSFVAPVPLYAGGAGAHPTLLGIVIAAGPETAFHFTTQAAPSKIVIDPHMTLLCVSE